MLIKKKQNAKIAHFAGEFSAMLVNMKQSTDHAQFADLCIQPCNMKQNTYLAQFPDLCVQPC